MSRSERPGVVVTGAGSRRGIGRATAVALAADGWAVGVMDVDEAGVRDTAVALAEHGNDPALWAAGDIGSTTDVDAAIKKLAAGLPSIDALINVAGITLPRTTIETSPDEWDRVFAVNARGTFLATRAVLPQMIERRYGRIVNLSSVSAERGGGIFGGAAYASAKAAILGFTRAVAREVAAYGITSNAVAPGLVDTDLAAPHLSPEQRHAVLAGIPAGRLATTADVQAAISFLCSEGAGYITGEVIDVNGGSHID